MYRYRLLFLFLVISFFSCKQDDSYKTSLKDASLFHESVKKLTDVIVHDIFSPPVASRIYAYPSIAAYEILARSNPAYKSLAGQLNDLEKIPDPSNPENTSSEIAATYAFMNVGKALIFSEEKIEAYLDELDEKYKQLKVPSSVLKNSKAYAEKVTQHMLSWSSKDQYSETRSFPKFEITDDPARWKPTPPVYMESIEPHWSMIRPFAIDSAQQFLPGGPTPYDLAKKSKFFKEAQEVYDVVNNATEEHKEIASFWDCNPYVVSLKGHAMYAVKKITPGGHWIGICKIAAEKTNADIMKSSYTYALTSICLADAFISCWDEKYRSNLIRPESIINENIDPMWKPLLQTPPFPEHTSGHSVISTAAAHALTQIYGENFAFDDTSELEYGLAVRSFDSFLDASQEAAVSRLYGGIHYRPAIDLGVDQGERLAKFVLAKIKVH